MRYQLCGLLVISASLALPMVTEAQMQVPMSGVSLASLGGPNTARARCQIKLTGRIFPEGEPIPKDARVVRLRFPDSVVPLVLDPEGENPNDPKYQSFSSDMAKEVYDSLLRITVGVRFEHKYDMAQVDDRKDSSDRLRVDGCARGSVMPILEISSVRRSH